MNKALTRAKPATTKKDETESNTAPKPKPASETEKEIKDKDPIAEIVAKLGKAFTYEDVKRQYELSGNDKMKTLEFLTEQKERDEEMKNRTLFKKLDEAKNAKTLNQMTIKPPKETILFEIFKGIGDNKPAQGKPMTLKHPKLKDALVNFSKPSPDKMVAVNRTN